MLKSVIKSTLFPFLVLAAICLAGPGDLSANNRKKEKQRVEELSYQQAGNTSSATSTPVRTVDGQEWVDPNATVVRGTPRARLAPGLQMVMNLNERKMELQKQVDLLGAELKTARGARARKITKEVDVLADQIAIIDRKLAAMPKGTMATIPDVYADSKPFHRFVDSLVDKRITEEGFVRDPESDTPATDNYRPTQVPVIQKVVYRVQIAVMTRPNAGTYSALGDVKELQRPDGKYAYYYGTYPAYAEAQAACKRLRAKPQYRDAFVVAMQGTRRISLQEAAQMTAIR